MSETEKLRPGEVLTVLTREEWSKTYMPFTHNDGGRTVTMVPRSSKSGWQAYDLPFHEVYPQPQPEQQAQARHVYRTQPAPRC